MSLKEFERRYYSAKFKIALPSGEAATANLYLDLANVVAVCYVPKAKAGEVLMASGHRIEVPAHQAGKITTAWNHYLYKKEH